MVQLEMLSEACLGEKSSPHLPKASTTCEAEELVGPAAKAAGTRPWLISETPTGEEVMKVYTLYEVAMELLEDPDVEDLAKIQALAAFYSRCTGFEPWVPKVFCGVMPRDRRIAQMATKIIESGTSTKDDISGAKLVLAHSMPVAAGRDVANFKLTRKAATMVDECMKEYPDDANLVMTRAELRSAIADANQEMSPMLLAEAVKEAERAAEMLLQADEGDCKGDNPRLASACAAAGCWKLAMKQGEEARQAAVAMLERAVTRSGPEHWSHALACYSLAQARIDSGAIKEAQKRKGAFTLDAELKLYNEGLDYYVKGMKAEKKLRRWFPADANKALRAAKKIATASLHAVVKKGAVNHFPYENAGCCVEWCPGNSVGKLQACKACGVPRYCSRDCQKMHWQEHHRSECKALKAWQDKLAAFKKKEEEKAERERAIAAGEEPKPVEESPQADEQENPPAPEPQEAKPAEDAKELTPEEKEKAERLAKAVEGADAARKAMNASAKAAFDKRVREGLPPLKPPQEEMMELELNPDSVEQTAGPAARGSSTRPWRASRTQAGVEALIAQQHFDKAMQLIEETEGDDTSRDEEILSTLSKYYLSSTMWDQLCSIDFWSRDTGVKLHHMITRVLADPSVPEDRKFPALLCVTHQFYAQWRMRTQTATLQQIVDFIDGCMAARPKSYALLITKAKFIFARIDGSDAEADYCYRLEAMSPLYEAVGLLKEAGKEDSPAMGVAHFLLAHCVMSMSEQDGDGSHKEGIKYLTHIAEHAGANHWYYPHACYYLSIAAIGKGDPGAKQYHDDDRVKLQDAYDWYVKGLQSERRLRSWWPVSKLHLMEQEKRQATALVHRIVDLHWVKSFPYNEAGCCIPWCRNDASWGVAPHQCSGCSIVRYCGRDHQRKHWKNGHREECKVLREQRDEAAADPVVTAAA